ncbi:hypothetical protein ABZ816_31440 [Actinosynnema sp. NPDC047251]
MLMIGGVLLVGVVGAVMATGGALAIAGAQTAADAQSSLVEDFSYPGADVVWEQRNIRVIRGDGRLVMTTCGSPGLIEVRRSNATLDKDVAWRGHYCFKATGPSGRLEVEIPDTFQFNGLAERRVDVVAKVDDKIENKSGVKDIWTGIGVADDQEGKGPAILLEIKVS